MMKGDTISRSALKKMLIKQYGEDDRSYDAAIALTAVQHAPTVEPPVIHGALTDIYVRDKSDGSIHRVGDDRHDSLDVRNGVVSYHNLQNGEGTGEHGDYEFVDSMWGEMDGGEGE